MRIIYETYLFRKEKTKEPFWIFKAIFFFNTLKHIQINTLT